MRRIVVSLLKGGVAKSETSVHLAHGLALNGYKVLLVDTDVQSHCAGMLGVHPVRGLAQVLAGINQPWDALEEARPNLWLLAGGNDLAGIKMEIARREIAPEAVLADGLGHFEGGFDYLVMDTAPGWDTLLVNALYASREVLSPVSMEPMALSGLRNFEERLAIIQKYNRELELRWVVPTFVDGRVRMSAAIMRQLKAKYGDRVTQGINYSARLSETTAFGKTIYEHEPKGPGAQGYMRLTLRVIQDGHTLPNQGTASPGAQPPLTPFTAPLAPGPRVGPPGVEKEPPVPPSPAPQPSREGPVSGIAAAASARAGREASRAKGFSLRERLRPASEVSPRISHLAEKLRGLKC